VKLFRNSRSSPLPAADWLVELVAANRDRFAAQEASGQAALTGWNEWAKVANRIIDGLPPTFSFGTLDCPELPKLPALLMPNLTLGAGLSGTDEMEFARAPDRLVSAGVAAEVMPVFLAELARRRQTPDCGPVEWLVTTLGNDAGRMLVNAGGSYALLLHPDISRLAEIRLRPPEAPQPPPASLDF
jgi:hypothetical protein